MEKRKPAGLPTPPSLWSTLGPSFILLGLALGSGELILWPYLAANWGLGLMWGALLGITFQFVLNTETMRYSLAWGESVFVGFWRLSRLVPLWFIFSTFVPWSLPGFSSAASQIVTHLLPWSAEWVVTLVLLLATGLLLSSGKSVYNTMERFQRTIILVGLPFIVVIAFLVSSPEHWLALFEGMIGIGDGFLFLPQTVAWASFLGAFAYSGAGGNLNLAQSYYIKEKGFGMGAYAEKISSLFSGDAHDISLTGQTFPTTKKNVDLWKKWWKLVNTEHFLVFWLLGFITIAVLSVLAYATVFGQTVEEGLSFVFAEAVAIGQITYPLLGVFFLIIAAVMLFSTQVGVLESSSRIISENVMLLVYKKAKKST